MLSTRLPLAFTRLPTLASFPTIRSDSVQFVQGNAPYKHAISPLLLYRRSAPQAKSNRYRMHLSALPNYKIARLSLDQAIAKNSRFPWIDRFDINRDLVLDADTVINTLSPLISEERQQRIADVVSKRTFNVLPILEYPYDLGNVAAACRSADALGFGGLSVVRALDDKTRYKQSTRTSGGADKWLDVQIYRSMDDCLSRTKKLGYQIVATHLRRESVAPADIDWTKVRRDSIGG